MPAAQRDEPGVAPRTLVLVAKRVRITKLSDGEVVRAHLEGNPLAFPELYRRYWPLLVRFIARFVRDQDFAEDIVQETFMKFATFGGTITDSSKVKSWFYATARHHAIDEMRRLNRRRIPDEYAEELIEHQDGDEDVEMIFKGRYTPQAIRDALAKVRPLLARPFYMAHVENKSHAEIAEHFNISVPNVKMRIHRAKTKLREILEQGAE